MTQDQGACSASAVGLSIFERGPRDLRIHWEGTLDARWEIGISCNIKTADELRALVEILSLLSAASEPSETKNAPTPEPHHDH